MHLWFSIPVSFDKVNILADHNFSKFKRGISMENVCDQLETNEFLTLGMCCWTKNCSPCFQIFWTVVSSIVCPFHAQGKYRTYLRVLRRTEFEIRSELRFIYKSLSTYIRRHTSFNFFKIVTSWINSQPLKHAGHVRLEDISQRKHLGCS